MDLLYESVPDLSVHGSSHWRMPILNSSKASSKSLNLLKSHPTLNLLALQEAIEYGDRLYSNAIIIITLTRYRVLHNFMQCL